jgi:rSAM/selenodomain-associated transferase 1
MTARLCIFARTPELGRVKQRLAREIGDEAALAAHEALLHRAVLQHSAGSGSYRIELWLTNLAVPLPDWLQDSSFELHEQKGGDLGQRMLHTFESALAAGSACILVGSDCPDIDAAYVESAIEALTRADVVFGPAEDGGYGLVGMKRPIPEIFTESRWGDSQVLARALERAERAGVSVALLPEIYDVDELADWQRYQQDGSPG